jgi:F-type H+-transporting ATPase subunit delta
MTKTSNRYAKALFEKAIEKSSIDQVLVDLKLILNSINEEAGLVKLIKNPTITKNIKTTIFEKAFESKINRITMDFLSLVIAKSRESFLSDIIKKYIHLYNRHNNISVAQIISAQPLSEVLKEIIKQKINTGDSVQLDEKIDKSLLGGFIIKIGDLRYDASVRKKISNAKRAFKL